VNTGDAQTESSRQLWLVPDEGRTHRGPVADVALRFRAPHPYSYAVPDDLAPRVRPGVWVRVPYGRGGRLVEGVCLRVDERVWTQTQKPIAEVLSAEPVLTPALIELGLWIGEYYGCPPGMTLAALVPSAARQTRRRRVVYLRATGQSPESELTPKRQALWDLLRETPLPRSEALERAGVGASVADALCAMGLLEVVTEHEEVPPDVAAPSTGPRPPCPEDAFTLNDGQQAALDRINQATQTEDLFRVLLLFGVPGSGKTEVYVRAIREVIARGRQAILLVPEIALATQIIQRLARRFDRVAILHGWLSTSDRRATWHAIAAGGVDVVIGTRSAVFAPCPNLGLIVVDEEQDSSYKNLAAPYYHARDAAIKRAQNVRVVCVLGSATPSLETWHSAQTLGHFELLRLPGRVAGARLPDVRLVEMGRRELGQTTTILSPELQQHLVETLAAGEQAILLHNRRGYALHLRCTACGLIIACPRCRAHLVFHHADNTMRCHRCGVREPVPPRCPDSTCGRPLERRGLAIQRLEEELTRLVPEARLLRVDRDTMRRRGSYEEALARFEAGDADLLLGTQMVAKGLDFPRVRLVGVIDADAAPWLTRDFRSAEHVFQLVMQVVGRAGRHEGRSLAVVQSAGVPEMRSAIRWAIRMDYEHFAAELLTTRRRFQCPPFTRLLRIVLADARPGRVREEACRLATELTGVAGRLRAGLSVREAAPCAIGRLREMARWEIVVQGPRDDSIQRFLRTVLSEKTLTARVQRLTVDVDPVDML
jgi:primosomal protein N' (replication factor Y)